MLAASRIAVRFAPQLRTITANSGSTVCAPPSIRVSTGEKFAHAFVMAVVCLATPAYVLVNIKKYRGLE